MPEGESLAVLGIGVLLGARHALDADHVAAVATILAERPEVKTCGFLGLCWGVGHTLVLLLVAWIVVALHTPIPSWFARTMDVGVGIMLVALGASLAVKISRKHWHVHAHQHGGQTHLHLHSHSVTTDHTHGHWLRLAVRPVTVGILHGLAGSAAVALMSMSTVTSHWAALMYVLVFGLGSILGMLGVGLTLSVPLLLSASMGRHAFALLQGLTSLASMVLGVSLIST